MAMRSINVSEYVSPLGVGAVAASTKGVCQVWLPGDDDLKTMSNAGYVESALTRRAAQQLQQYFQKRLQQFDLPLDISSLPAFRQQILLLATQIPYGTVVTYGQLALRAGAPKAARAVGGALAANPIPVVIPCHRIISASGNLTGYSGPGGISMKKILLSLETVEFRGKNF